MNISKDQYEKNKYYSPLKKVFDCLCDTINSLKNDVVNCFNISYTLLKYSRDQKQRKDSYLRLLIIYFVDLF